MIKKRNAAFRVFSLALTFVLMINFVSVQGAMNNSTNISPDTSQNSVTNVELENSEITVLCEDVSLREENVKHFIMSDHSYRAVVYATHVHYQKDGEWVDINNALTSQNVVLGSDDDFVGQITTEGPFSVKFANNSNSSKLVRIDKDNYRLSWAYSSASKRDAIGNVKASVSSRDTVIDAVTNTSSTIAYNYVEENASLEYEVTSTGVKENIIIHSAADTYTFAFDFKTKGVYLSPSEDGSIEVIANDTDEVVFVIPAPFMIDASGRYSNAVSYSLSNLKNNKATLTISADPNWINSNDTQFPVVIDPIITTERTRSEIDSAFVASNYASTNCGGSNYSLLSVGHDSAGPGKTRTLIKFSDPTLKKRRYDYSCKYAHVDVEQ